MVRHDSSPPTSAAAPHYDRGPTHVEPVGARALTKIARRHRLLIFGTVGAITGFAVLLAANLTPRYTGVASVTIDPQATRVVNTEAILAEQAQDRWTIETHVTLLRSRSFARRLVTQAGLLADPEFNTALQPPEEPSLIAQHVQRFRDWLSGLGLVEIGLAMASLPHAAVPSPDAQAAVEDAIDHFLGRLEVTRPSESYAISIHFTSTDPVKAARLANQIAELYVEEQLAAKQAAATRAAEWLSGRVSELRDRLAQAENAIAIYKADNELIDNQALCWSRHVHVGPDLIDSACTARH